MIFGAACLLGTVQHFLYEPLGRPAALRWLLPISESPWEHFKLAFWPLCAGLALWGGLQGAAAGAILCACCLAASHAFCTMMGIYFFYRAALAAAVLLGWVAAFLLPEDKTPVWPLFADPSAAKNKGNRE